MNKEERQRRHQERLALKRERDAKSAEYRAYFWRFYDEGVRLLKDLPEPASVFSHTVALFYTPTNQDYLHYRIEWNDEIAVMTKKTWKYGEDCEHYMTMPQGEPDDPRTPEDYWNNVRPKIVLEQLNLLQEDIADLIEFIDRLRLPPQATYPNCLCCDGEGYELTFHHIYAMTTWKWHCDPPECWKELGVVAKKILEWNEKRTMTEICSS